MSTRRIDSLVGTFIIALCLTGCFETTVTGVPEEKPVNYKNYVSPHKQTPPEETKEDTLEEEDTLNFDEFDDMETKKNR